MARYLDPKNDLTFKRIFGEHKHLCMSLLNNMLPFDDEHKIISVEYLSAELTPEIPENRNSIVDVRCIDQTGRQFLVEMQMFWTDSFTSRVLFNASKAYVKQLKKGRDYKYLQPVYALSFVNDVFDHENPDEYYHHYKIVNIRGTGKQIEGLEFVFIELPKFKPSNKAERKLHELWMRFLDIEDATREVSEELLQEADIREALGYLEEGAYSDDEMYLYDKYWDAVSVERTLVADGLFEGRAQGLAEGFFKGLSEGKVKGLIEGKAKGLSEGKAKGKAETLERIVVDAKRTGFSLEQIQTLTKLTAAQIVDILKRHEIS